MDIVHRPEVRRSKRKLKVPTISPPISEGHWADQDSDEDPSYIPPPTSSDDDISLEPESDEEHVSSELESDIETTETEDSLDSDDSSFMCIN